MANRVGQSDGWLLRFRWLLPLILLPPALVAALQAGDKIMPVLSLDAWEYLCLAIALSGVVIRALAVGFADDGALPSSGVYSVVRYPLHLGSCLSLVGLSMLPGAPWFVLATIAALLIWYGRLIDQTERALAQRFACTYPQWAAKTPAFVPRTLQWRPPGAAFSPRRVLTHESNDFYFVVAGFVFLEFACDVLGERETLHQWLSEDMKWAALFLAGTFAYAAIRLAGPFPDAATTGARTAAPDRPARAGRSARASTAASSDESHDLWNDREFDAPHLAALIAARLGPGDRLVEVGCGSGALAVLASLMVPDSRNPIADVLGIDAAAGKIAAARKRASLAGSSARFRIGAAEALPLDDASVGALVSTNILHPLPSEARRQTLREMRRVLKPGGRLVIAELVRPASLADIIEERHARSALRALRAKPADDIIAALRAEGFRDAEVVETFGCSVVIRGVKPGGSVASGGAGPGS